MGVILKKEEEKREAESSFREMGAEGKTGPNRAACSILNYYEEPWHSCSLRKHGPFLSGEYMV